MINQQLSAICTEWVSLVPVWGSASLFLAERSQFKRPLGTKLGTETSVKRDTRTVVVSRICAISGQA
jgi:hypothetical protein